MKIFRNIIAVGIMLATASFAVAQYWRQPMPMPIIPPACDSITNSGSPATGTSFEVYANNVQNASKVLFPTWTDANGQDELIWYEGEYDAANNRWKRTVNISEHNNELGNYTIHCYAIGSDKQTHWLGNTSVTMVFAQPGCDSVTTSANPTSGMTYEVYANNVQNASKVLFPTWTDANGQDELIWYEGEYDAANNRWKRTVNIGEHNNELGSYTTHAYGLANDNKYYILGGTNTTVVNVTNQSPTVPLYRVSALQWEGSMYYGTVRFGWFSYLTTDSNASGSSRKDLVGNVFTDQVAGSVPLYEYYKKVHYEWYNQGSNDSTDMALFFHTTNHNELGSGAQGYSYVKIVCYVYPDQKQGTVPLYRYLRSDEGIDHSHNIGEHFYTTNPSDPLLAPTWIATGGKLEYKTWNSNFTPEGIQCYLLPP